jgi:hypothetical protein
MIHNHKHSAQKSMAPRYGGPSAFAPVYEALYDDLNTPAAFGALFSIVNRGSAGVGRLDFDRVVHDALGLQPPQPVVGISNLATFLKNTESYRRDLRRKLFVFYI